MSIRPPVAILAGQVIHTGGTPLRRQCLLGESVTDPALDYRNNLGASLTLFEALKGEGERRGVPPRLLVFSSTFASFSIP